jgi:hypothetical protein
MTDKEILIKLFEKVEVNECIKRHKRVSQTFLI